MTEDNQHYTKTFPISWEQLHRDAKALAWRLVGMKPWQGIVTITRGGLVPASIIARELEQLFSRNGKRTCNLDAGYLDSDKLVLGSFKGASTKLYLGRGVFADMILQYAKGAFNPMPWAFENFKDGRYDKDLLAVREKYKAELKRCRTR